MRLNFYQAGLVYALLAEANGRVFRIDPVLPSDVIIEPVEQGRREIAPHQPWSFGVTLLASTPMEAQESLQRIRDGLSQVGRQSFRHGVTLGGNFRVAEIFDLVSDRNLHFAEAPSPISESHMQSEIDRALAMDRWTLRFTMPLRMSHSKHGLAEQTKKSTSKNKKPPKPDLMDRHRFNLGVFLRKIAQRVEQAGFITPSPAKIDTNDESVDHTLESVLDQSTPPTSPPSEIKSPAAASTPMPAALPTVVENNLCWCDVSYSAGEREKHLPGALGDITLTGLTRQQVTHLVYGQYLHVGENTRFGLGRYRISQLGHDPFYCPRSVSLRDLAFGPRFLDTAAERYGLEPGRASELARSIAAGTYEPKQPFRITIPSGTRERVLAIPHPQDRTLQRAVLDFIGPTLDRVLEASSIAYRRGQGRETAARRIQQATKEGYQWALKADFTDFFDSVDHAQLRQRLRVYVADSALEGLIMKWVRSGAPEPNRGLPTGSVVSPLLANLFLDEFDVAIAKGGGRLLRYADDFVILFKNREDADRIRQLAEQEAEVLKLKLNESKTALIDLREPFRFLGFEFSFQEDWTHTALSQTHPLHEIGWRDISQSKSPASPTILPGESGELSTTSRALALLGPDLFWLDVRGHTLRRKRDAESAPEDILSVDRIDHLFVAGFPSLHRNLLRYLARSDTPLLLASDNGLDEVWITSRPNEDPALVRQQIVCHDDALWRLEISRLLVASKLDNYATLAVTYPARDGDTSLPATLQQLARSAESATTVDQLLGFEGAGANAWYGNFRSRAHHRFQFPGRRAPRADDPLNILLNIGFTALHNWTAHFLRVHGFAPTLGVLHGHRAGHAALASDLMEPFRHLVDAVVLDCSRLLSSQDFQYDQKGPFPTAIKFPALKRFREALWKRLQTFHLPPKRDSAQPYLKSLERQVITLRHHLLDRERKHPFYPFRQIPAASVSPTESPS